MTPNEQDPTTSATPAEGQARPETGINQDPSTNTSPPSNPAIDEEALEKGKENINSVVSW